MPFTSLSKELEARADQGLLRQRRTLDSPQAPHCIVDGKPYLAFCSNDYLGLAHHPRLVAALQRGAQRGTIRAASGREIPLIFSYVTVLGSHRRFDDLYEGLHVGYDVSWTSSGLRVCVIRIPEE